MLAIRADMNQTIATGHVMRCLSIADAAKKSGEEVVFLLADDNGCELIASRGHRAIVLGTDWKQMESEIPVLEAIFREEKIHRILVDSYQVTPRYLTWLSAHLKTAYLDDVNAFHYPVDTLICYAPYYPKFHWEESYPDTKLLLGTAYVPLRAPYLNAPRKDIREEVQNLLLLSGGTDPLNTLPKLLAGMTDKAYRQITVICGMYYPGYDALCDKYRDNPHVVLHRSVNNLWDYMKEADVTVSAGGSTLYELCALGVPTISFSIADNQLDNVTQFAADGIIPYAGDVRTDQVPDKVIELLEKYRYDKSLRSRTSLAMQAMVDGKGAERILGKL